MKNSFFFGLVFIILSSISGYSQDKIPTGTIQDLEGHPVALKDVFPKDKITILSFWATWCAPCKKELDAYTELYQQWTEKYPLEIVAISIDNRRAFPQIAPMVKSKNWPFPIYWDHQGKMQESFGFFAIPQTYLINQSGKIIAEHAGFTSNVIGLLEYEIKQIMKE
jgi:cytochrome c biogenesis protein CcmG/thiol:disulfide interchange protein DsbE